MARRKDEGRQIQVIHFVLATEVSAWIGGVEKELTLAKNLQVACFCKDGWRKRQNEFQARKCLLPGMHST
jgi:hypothetical protein